MFLYHKLIYWLRRQTQVPQIVLWKAVIVVVDTDNERITVWHHNRIMWGKKSLNSRRFMRIQEMLVFFCKFACMFFHYLGKKIGGCITFKQNAVICKLFNPYMWSITQHKMQYLTLSLLSFAMPHHCTLLRHCWKITCSKRPPSAIFFCVCGEWGGVPSIQCPWVPWKVL